MKLNLRPLGEQVIVITGADSGIGLATVRMAAEGGAALVLNSRNPQALARIADELRSQGAEVAWHAGDVANEAAMHQLAEVALTAFGRIDTWINNAGVSLYGEIERTPVDDVRRLFETNYFGVVNGSLAALPFLRREGGALINVGSVLSGVAIPLQGHYAASKHAVKGFTDALRQELAHDEAPVAVTLIRPAAIDTPYTEHAHNHMAGAEPDVPAPVYAPRVVARAILDCAVRPQREVLVGGAARQMEMVKGLSDRLYDRYAESVLWRQQRAAEGSKRRGDALHAPATAGRERGDYDGHVMRTSAYTRTAQHPLQAALTLGVLGVAAYALSRSGLLGLLNDELRARLGREDGDEDARREDFEFAAEGEPVMEVVEVETTVVAAAPDIPAPTPASRF